MSDCGGLEPLLRGVTCMMSSGCAANRCLRRDLLVLTAPPADASPSDSQTVSVRSAGGDLISMRGCKAMPPLGQDMGFTVTGVDLGAAARVTSRTTTTYVTKIHGKRRKFWTVAAAYYAIAKESVGTKYLGPMREVERWERSDKRGARPNDETLSRAARGHALFDHEAGGFDTKRWATYVRRVANMWRRLDGAGR